MKTINDYLQLPYTIELQPEQDGTWFVAIKELPGCMSAGDTPEDAVAMVRDAQKAWIETALEENISIPEPRLEEEYSGNFRLRISKSLHRRLVEAADQEGVSLNTLCSTALAQALGGRSVTRRTENFAELANGMQQLLKFIQPFLSKYQSLESQFSESIKEEVSE